MTRLIRETERRNLPLLILCVRFRDWVMPDADLLGDEFERPHIRGVKHYQFATLTGIKEDIGRFLNEENSAQKE
jgi:hypothetical protein